MKIEDLSFCVEVTEEDTDNVNGGDNFGATFTFKPKANIFTFKPKANIFTSCHPTYDP
jgi:hypothetical protein